MLGLPKENPGGVHGGMTVDADHVYYYACSDHIEKAIPCTNCGKIIYTHSEYLRCTIDTPFTRYCKNCAEEHMILCKLAN